MSCINVSSPGTSFLLGVVTTGAILAIVKVIISRRDRRRKGSSLLKLSAYEQLVGKTPLVRLRGLSDLLGCEVFGKAEFVNPGGSVKDRFALSIVNALKKDNGIADNTTTSLVGHALDPPTIYEGTSGSTGISLCLASIVNDMKCVVYMPDDQALKKRNIIKSLGGMLELVRPVSIVDPSHICKAAKAGAEKNPNGYFVNQFENELNFKTHFNTTAVEILNDTKSIENGREVSVFVASAGTGGTMAGVSARLKLELGKNKITTILADSQGSALANRVNEGTLFHTKDKEGHRVKHPFDTVTEGIGLNRLTRNFQLGIPFIDRAYTVTDQEALDMSRYLLRTDGLFLGSSSAVNCACIVKAFKNGVIKKGDVVVTILCDSGYRHLSKFWNTDYVQAQGLQIPISHKDPLEFIAR